MIKAYFTRRTCLRKKAIRTPQASNRRIRPLVSREYTMKTLVSIGALFTLVCFFSLFVGPADAHGVAEDDKRFLLGASGPNIPAFLYLGAKHMVTGYDHLLFIAGVVFFLYRFRDIAIFVSLFSLGHSITLIAGVLLGVGIDARIIDAIIGLSVAWKAFDNLSGFQTVVGFRPDLKFTVFGFGLFHGLGLAAKLQDFELSGDGLLINLLSFNVGVEIGQLLALAAIVLFMNAWRLSSSFERTAIFSNFVLMTAGFLLVLYQLSFLGFGME